MAPEPESHSVGTWKGCTADQMRVLYDAQTFLRQRRGGISRLFAQLIAQFDADPGLGVTADLPFRWSNNTHVTNDLTHRALRRPPSWLPREVLYGAHLLRRPGRPSAADLVHHTYYSRQFLQERGHTPQVITVYDMIPELFAGTPEATGTHLQKRDYVSTCDLVICISESTRRDMVEVYGDLAENVVTIPLSVDPLFRPNLPSLPDLPHEYLLYVGKRSGYKDFELLAPAMAELKNLGLEIPVVAVGAPFSRDEENHLTRWGVSEIFRTHRLTDAELAQAYANATVLAQTSRYEGFGLTPLEGMAAGAPVVIADASSMPEVGGDVAHYFTPGDAESLAATLAELLSNDASRAEAGVRGIARAKLFTPQLMAEGHAEAYRSTLQAW